LDTLGKSTNFALMKRATIFFVAVLFCLATQAQERRRDFNQPFVTETPMAHDPVLAWEDSIFHVFSTGVGIQHLTSKDLRKWTIDPRPVMSVIPQWTRDSVEGFVDHVWAPDIIRWKGRWWMTYSCSTFGKNGSAIGLMSNGSLDGRRPWQDHGVIVCSHDHRDNWNAIDPNIIIDQTDGQPWLTYGSFWDGIQLVRLDSTLHVVEGTKPQTIARRHKPGDPSAAPNPTSRFAGPNAIEAPFLFRHGDYFYLFVSWDYCCRGEKSNYRVAVGRSKTIYGPYLDDKGVPMLDGGGKVLIEGDKQQFEAIGHCAAYHIGDRDIYVSHGYSVAHRGAAILVVREIQWENGWPKLCELKID